MTIGDSSNASFMPTPPSGITILSDGNKNIFYYNPKPWFETSIWRVHTIDNSEHVVFFSQENISAEWILDTYKRISNLCSIKVPYDISSLLAWPIQAFDNIILNNGGVKVIAIVAPVTPKKFFYDSGFLSGRAKEALYCFTSAKFRNLIPADCLPDKLSMMTICWKLASVLSWLESQGLVHQSFPIELLIDGSSTDVWVGNFWDIRYEEQRNTFDIQGAPDYMAPELVMRNDHNVTCPTVLSQRHTLAVLLYKLLFQRHPLRWGKINSAEDAEEDERLTLGERALFIEHPMDKSNHPENGITIPYIAFGSCLAKLFEAAFIKGLDNPPSRPAPSEWATAFDKCISSQKHNIRRFPFYIILDINKNMWGEPIERAVKVIQALLKEWRNDPYALETLYISIITVGKDFSVLCPLNCIVEIGGIKTALEDSNIRQLSRSFFKDRLVSELYFSSIHTKGDYKPNFLLLSCDDSLFKTVESILNDCLKHPHPFSELAYLYCNCQDSDLLQRAIEYIVELYNRVLRYDGPIEDCEPRITTNDIIGSFIMGDSLSSPPLPPIII